MPFTRISALLPPLLAFTGLYSEIFEIRPVIIAIRYLFDKVGYTVDYPAGRSINVDLVKNPCFLLNNKDGEISDARSCNPWESQE